MNTSKHYPRIGSHNAMTYLTPRLWYMRPFAALARCQDLNIDEQIDAGCTFFDLRIRPTHVSRLLYNMHFAHGLITYQGAKPIDVIKHIEERAKHENRDLSILLTLEKSKYHELSQKVFIEFCKELHAQGLTTLTKACTKHNWEIVYDFGKPIPPLRNRYSSAPSEKGKVDRIRSIYPRAYARRYNDTTMQPTAEPTTHTAVIDFVGRYYQTPTPLLVEQTPRSLLYGKIYSYYGHTYQAMPTQDPAEACKLCDTAKQGLPCRCYFPKGAKTGYFKQTDNNNNTEL